MRKTLFAAALLLAVPGQAALFKGKAKPAAAKAADPLRPLSAEELASAVSVVREAGVLGSSATFALVTLREPAKDDVPARRSVHLVVVDAERRETSEAVVDPAERKLTSWRLLIGVAPARSPFTPPAPEPAEPKGDDAPVPTSEIELDGHQARWNKWRLRVAAHSREGLVLSDVSFDGRRVLARASASEVARQGADGLALVEGEEGFGRRTRALSPRVDAPADAAFLPATFCDNDGRPFTLRRAVALFPRRSTGAARELVIKQAVSSQGREIVQLWILRQNGELEASVEVSGSTTATETHLFSYRLDLDVDGSTNSLVELGGGSPSPLRTALAARRDAAPGRRWLVSSSATAAGYVLTPGEGSPAPSADLRRAGFLSRSLWALPYASGRMYAGGEYPSGRPDGLERWAREDESLEERDLVLWHVFGAQTSPDPAGRAWARAGFRLTPWGRLSKDPS